MARTKHKKIVEVNLLPNVFNIKNGSTDKDIVKYFANENPISLEIGCGHGDYTISLARNFSHRNFILLRTALLHIHIRPIFCCFREKILCLYL